jgi:hypothetical protein
MNAPVVSVCRFATWPARPPPALSSIDRGVSARVGRAFSGARKRSGSLQAFTLLGLPAIPSAARHAKLGLEIKLWRGGSCVDGSRRRQGQGSRCPSWPRSMSVRTKHRHGAARPQLGAKRLPDEARVRSGLDGPSARRSRGPVGLVASRRRRSRTQYLKHGPRGFVQDSTSARCGRGVSFI